MLTLNLIPSPSPVAFSKSNPINASVYCGNDVLQLLSAGGFYYKIISINPSSYRLVINPPLIPKDTCYSSDLTSEGFRLDDDSPFNISTRNTVMLLNCSDNILLSPLNCSSSSLCRLFEEQVEAGSGCRGQAIPFIHGTMALSCSGCPRTKLLTSLCEVLCIGASYH
ncbi:protein kinase domain-containing protein [Citrus sinensis]|uniref:Protein kinase domain-containing protein n=1 Tax=Citrus sinensis TaxID=2711 RepID=A0ACB8JER5_CITSI|nr:protein kinase domain-containing protein [Citrus sinensis]